MVVLIMVVDKIKIFNFLFNFVNRKIAKSKISNLLFLLNKTKSWQNQRFFIFLSNFVNRKFYKQLLIIFNIC